jgi:hypothetical protein
MNANSYGSSSGFIMLYMKTCYMGDTWRLLDGLDCEFHHSQNRHQDCWSREMNMLWLGRRKCREHPSLNLVFNDLTQYNQYECSMKIQ